jgi:(1->4)-alpha-D-glucan 1-alpha-D-glucosylmutase
MTGYAVKAAREGKLESSWAVPDAGYEEALTGFIEKILDPALSADFLRSFSDVARRAALLGALNSLSQVTLKLTLPGVPDFYQGTELWDLSLVDPDNRRPVDFAKRRDMAAALACRVRWDELCAQWPDGRIKLALTRRLLACRREYAELFSHGGYQGLSVAGRDRDNIVAFSRSWQRGCVAVAVARHFRDVADGGLRWPDADAWQASVRLPGRAPFRNLLACGPATTRSGPVEVRELFQALPVAVLVSA